MARILLAGDFHGNKGHTKLVFADAQKQSADLVFQLGDYGYGWEKTQVKGGNGAVVCGFTDFVSKQAQAADIPFYWIDGNHEDFDFLEDTLKGLVPELDGTYEIAPMVYYVPRGTVLDFDGKKFLCCGGATSIDKKRRVTGVSWWAQEAITDIDIRKCSEAGKADVLLSHDFPWEVSVVDRHLDPYWGEEAGHMTKRGRQSISCILDGCGARRVYHGHLHYSYREIIRMEIGSVTVMGLDRDTTPLQDSTYLLDTAGWGS